MCVGRHRRVLRIFDVRDEGQSGPIMGKQGQCCSKSDGHGGGENDGVKPLPCVENHNIKSLNAVKVDVSLVVDASFVFDHSCLLSCKNKVFAEDSRAGFDSSGQHASIRSQAAMPIEYLVRRANFAVS